MGSEADPERRLSEDGAAPDKRAVGRSFGQAAARYDAVAGLQRRVGIRLLERVESEMPSPRLALDLGAGTGFCSAALTRWAQGVVALDLSPAMLGRCRERLGAEVLYACGDAEHLPLAAGSVDLVVANLMLQWSDDLPAVFSEVFRVLDAGGALLLSSFGPRTLRELKAAWRTVDHHRHVNRFEGIERLGQEMATAGLTAIALETEMHRLHYPSALALMRELKQLGAHNVTHSRPRGLTGKGKLRRMISAYERATGTADSLASFEVIYGRAVKPVRS